MDGESKRLLRLYRSLPPEARQSLLDFAEFLASRAAAAAPPPAATEPRDIPRPAQESVIRAIRRLTETYPMLDRNQIFHETSAQMTRHVVHGVPAAEVIDELEVMFRRHYERLKTGD